MRTRMPFRYGIATMNAVPHLFLKLELEIDGTRASGVAADHLPPKWFTKKPKSSTQDDIGEMLRVIDNACRIARDAAPAANVFSLWRSIYGAQKSWAGTNYPPLLWGFGVTLVERAIIDAYCRARHTTFSAAIRQNVFGIELKKIHPELEDSAPADWLPKTPLTRVIARHTVGLSDPLTEGDIPSAERVGDVLPQSLEKCIERYGLTHFKIKLSGDVLTDLKRLENINKVITSKTTGAFSFTLDGNENFNEVESFKELWERLIAEPALRSFMPRLIFVEQPMHRNLALSEQIGETLRSWPSRPPMIIDESDATLDTLRTALSCGYSGTSHKNCKGVFKGIANACLISKLTREGRPAILSCEDLSNVGPVALLQDLAVVATLGIPHCERNGHHYFKGLSGLSHELQQTVAIAHPDLFTMEEGFARVRIKDGIISTKSATEAPFGRNFEFDAALFTPVGEWRYDSLA